MADHLAENSGVILSSPTYDVLRVLVEKVFPGLGVFYAAVATIWHWDYTVEVGGTFAALSVLGAVFLTLARKGYNPEVPTTDSFKGSYDGQVVEGISDTGEPTLQLKLNEGADLLNQERLVIKGYNSAAGSRE